MFVVRSTHAAETIRPSRRVDPQAPFFNTLLADDLAEILQTDGHTSIVAYGGQDALERADGSEFDLAIVDIRMPDMDGVALVHRLMRDRPRSSYLFMTGYASDRSISEATAISQGAVLYKPLNIERLLRLVAASGAAATS